ncbi:MAG: glycosyltransferase family 25 protein [Bacteroidales bacterium]|nr:glycosyltransferase family 25 protein [Bacteroidales bacterium]
MIIENILKEGVFVVHALTGYEKHEKRIIDLFKKLNINFEFVTDGDPTLFEGILSMYIDEDLKYNLNKGALSCTLNHILAYERIVAREIKYSLVFENDIFFIGDFKGNLKKIEQELVNLKPGFIISLENSTLRFPSFWQVKKGKFLYPAKAGRMAGAYLIDLVAAKNILEDLKDNKCNAVIDWWHNSLIQREIIKMYWVHPPMVEQGSHNGRLSSTISSHPACLFRRFAWILQKNYKYYIRRLLNDNNLILK